MVNTTRAFTSSTHNQIKENNKNRHRKNLCFFLEFGQYNESRDEVVLFEIQ